MGERGAKRKKVPFRGGVDGLWGSGCQNQRPNKIKATSPERPRCLLTRQTSQQTQKKNGEWGKTVPKCREILSKNRKRPKKGEQRVPKGPTSLPCKGKLAENEMRLGSPRKEEAHVTKLQTVKTVSLNQNSTENKGRRRTPNAPGGNCHEKKGTREKLAKGTRPKNPGWKKTQN